MGKINLTGGPNVRPLARNDFTLWDIFTSVKFNTTLFRSKVYLFIANQLKKILFMNSFNSFQRF